MAILLLLSILGFIHGGQCFLWVPGENANNNRRAFDFLSDMGEQGDLNSRLYNFLKSSGKRSNVNNQGNDEISLEDVLYASTITSSSQQTGNVMLTVQTSPSVDVLWMYKDSETHRIVFTIGTQENQKGPSLSLINYMDHVHLIIVGPTFIAGFAFNKDVMTNGSSASYTLAEFIDFIKDPENVSIVGNRLEFDIVQKSNFQYEGPFGGALYASFGADGSRFIFDDLRLTFQNVSSGKFRVSCNLPDSQVNEQIWSGFSYPIGRTSLVSGSIVIKKIPVRREEPIATKESIFIPEFEDLQMLRLTPTFKYDSLTCVAIGTSLPSVAFYKNGQLLNQTLSKSYYGLLNVAILPLGGKSMDEATGSYICRGTAGNITVEQQYFVEQFGFE